MSIDSLQALHRGLQRDLQRYQQAATDLAASTARADAGDLPAATVRVLTARTALLAATRARQAEDRTLGRLVDVLA